MTKYILSMALLCLALYDGYAQGCVAIRSSGASCIGSNPNHHNAKFQFSYNHRYFKSYKHFVGKVEQHERVKNQTEVINYTHFTDMNLTYFSTQRFSFNLSIPIVSNARSSVYEHGGNALGPVYRRSTHSFGLGDIRLSANYWILNPAKSSKGNVQFGLGIKLPTGDYNYQDYFYKADGSTVLGPVDQSIQLGDGGTGINVEYNAYYQLFSKLSIYSNGFYLSNPREQNGTSTARGGTSSATAVQYFTNTMSVPDQFMWRVGFTYRKSLFSYSGGLRIEGVPSKDLIGGNRGFRRPGYVLSLEPVVNRMGTKFDYYLSVPIAVVRNRTQSYSDKLRTKATNTYVHGDAAFADYSINFGIAYRF